MRHKKILSCLLFLYPLFIMGQVLQETNKASGGLPDPDEYPFGIYFKLGLPVASFAIETGHENIRQLFSDEGIDLPRMRSLNIFEVGMRYKRFYAELGVANQLFNSPIPTLYRNRLSVNTTHTMGWFDVGFSLWQNRNSALLLRLGFGAVGSGHQIRYLDNTAQVDFEDLFSDETTTPSTLIYHENSFLDIGVEWWKGRAKSRTSLGETVRFGYRWGINETAWEALDMSTINAPLDRMSEIYFQFCFHLGYNYPKKAIRK